jgi:hypothetical protein
LAHDIQEGDAALKADIREVHGILKAEIRDAESRLRSRIDTLEAKSTGERVLLKWMLGLLLGGVAALVLKTFF